MRLIPYVIYLLLIACHEVIFRDLTSIFGVTVNLPVLIVLVVALYKSEPAAIWFAFAAGLLVGVSSPAMAGWYALLTAALAAAAFHVRERLNAESLVSKLLLVFLGTFVYNVAAALVDGPAGFGYHLYRLLLPGTLYTALVAWIFFLFKEGRLTIHKIKAMF